MSKRIHTKKRSTRKNQNQNVVSKLQLIQDKERKYSFQPFEEEYGKTHRAVVTKSKEELEKDLIKQFQKPFTPRQIQPNDDFYTYINYSWLDKKEKNNDSDIAEKYFAQVDDFRLLQDKVYNQLIKLVDEFVTKDKTPRGHAAKNMYHSLLHLDERVLAGHMIDIHEEIQHRTSDLQDPDAMWKFLGWISINTPVRWGSPLFWNVVADAKDPTVFRSVISSPDFSLYDINFYFDNEGQDANLIKAKNKIKRKYLEYITTMFNKCLGNGHGLSANDVFDCETDIAMSLGCDGVKNDSPEYHNTVKAEDALRLYGFNWPAFTAAIGYKTPPTTFVVTSLNYLKCVCELLNKNWQTPKWLSYWNYIYLRQMIRFHKSLRILHHSFNEQFLKGIPDPFPYHLFPIFSLSVTFNALLTELYINKYKNEERIAYVKNMGNDMIRVFQRILQRNWFEPASKRAALLKLKHLQFIVGHPTSLREDPILPYKPNDPWGNMMLITRWRTDRFIELEGNPVIDIPIVDWNAFKLVGQQAYIVNAFYTPTQNSIYIPLAYIQPPFLDISERGIEYNLARLGGTLAHEMSHAFDESGSKYDHTGRLHTWMTERDMKIVQKVKKDIIAQYEYVAKQDGIDFDASIAIGENMADISGLAICEEYLRDFQDKNDDIVPIRNLSFQAFFVYYAASQRQHLLKNALQAQLKTNPHPLDKYRVNVPLSRLELFKSIYNIKKGDGMYWHSNSTIW